MRKKNSIAFDYINHPRRLTIHCMKYVENFAVLSPCEGGGFIYATSPAAFRFAPRSTAASCVVGSSSFTF